MIQTFVSIEGLKMTKNGAANGGDPRDRRELPDSREAGGSGEARDTKERILDAAELLFAELGFAETSLRQITTQAGVNLAAVNYHFGSKEGLIEAVMARRLEPLNRARLELLDRAEQEAGDKGPSLESILEAFIGPPLRMKQATGETGTNFMRLMGHAMNQPNERIVGLVTGQFEEVLRRFAEALSGALPGLPREQVLWRMLFSVGVMTHTMVMAKHLGHLSRGLVDPSDAEEVIRRMLPYLAGGFRAAAATAAPQVTP